MDEPSRPAPTQPMASAPPRTRRWLVVAVGVPAFALGVIIAARRPLLGMIVRSRAAALGVDLDFDSLDASFSQVRLGHVRASLSGVRGVRLTVASLRLGRRWLSLSSVDAEGIAVNLEGPASDRVLDLAAWSSDHADTYRLLVSARDVRVDWRARPDSPAWLTMSGGSITADGTSARFQAATTSAFGVPMGAVGASCLVEASGLTIEAGKRQGGGEAPLSATLKTSARPPTLALTLRPVEVSALGTALGVSLPARGAVASGHADLTLGRGAGAGAGVTGAVSLELEGWTPPHPHQLDGILAGNRTVISSHLHLSEDRGTVKLDGLEVRSGRLDLKGSGAVAEEGNHATVHLEIAGPVPCSDLARAVARDELGGVPFGGILGELAGHAVGGSAQVTVVIDADARDLAAAKVKPRVGLGCELKVPGL